MYFGQDAMPLNETYLCSKTIYIGRKNNALTTDSITLAATKITITDATYSYTWTNLVKAIKDLQSKVG